jgi:hypothetical protein
MKLEDIAGAYVAAVELEEKARLRTPELLEDITDLRADLHALLMDALRERGIPFADRADAARLAWEIVRSPAVPI